MGKKKKVLKYVGYLEFNREEIIWQMNKVKSTE